MKTALAVLTVFALSSCSDDNVQAQDEAGIAVAQQAQQPGQQPRQQPGQQPMRMPGAAAQEAPIRLTNVGLATPESFGLDTVNDLYLVTNANGAPDAIDNNGFISKVSPDGRIAELKWIDSTKKGVRLDGPKGWALAGGLLYVADVKSVRIFDHATGAPKGSIDVRGATFLNDVVAGADGNIYVSDTGVKTGRSGFEPTGTDAIYRISADRKVHTLISGKDLGGPNGLAFKGGNLIAVTMRSGEIFQVDPAGRKQMLPKPPTGNLDGVVALDDGRLLVSSWDGQCVYALGTDNTFTKAADNLRAPADIGYDAKRRRILIPLFNDNALVLQPLMPAAAAARP